MITEENMYVKLYVQIFYAAGTVAKLMNFQVYLHFFRFIFFMYFYLCSIDLSKSDRLFIDCMMVFLRKGKSIGNGI